MMRRTFSTLLASALAFSVIAPGCVRVTRETRTERGPVLRAYEREVPAGPGGIIARVEPKYPELVLAFEQFDRCRQERVEEVVEERITESHAPSAGPAFALGVIGTLGGTGLLAFRTAFSDQPVAGQIGVDGRFDPAPRQVATTWGFVLLGVGVPALVTGIVGLAQSGQKVETDRVEHVASSLEVPCQRKPVDGEVTLERATGPESVTARTQNGKVTLSAQQLRELRVASVHLDGQPVLLPEEENVVLQAFLSCSEALPAPSAEALTELPEQALVARYNAARRCAVVAPDAAKDAVTALEAEIQRRRGSTPVPIGSAPKTFEEALAAWPPSIRLEEGSPELQRLAQLEKAAGRTVYAKGQLEQRVDGSVILLRVAQEPLWIFTPPDAAFPTDFTEGTQIEVLGVMVGRQAVGSLEAPLIRAMWIRPVEGAKAP